MKALAAIATTAVLLGNLMLFAMLFVGAWVLFHGVLAVLAFLLGGVLASLWTRRGTAVAAPAAVTGVLAVAWLGWGQLAVDNVGVYTPPTDILPYLVRWPDVLLTITATTLAALLSLAGYVGGRSLRRTTPASVSVHWE
jgi:hypothetical protein